jgi:chromosome segregation ATPase
MSDRKQSSSEKNKRESATEGDKLRLATAKDKLATAKDKLATAKDKLATAKQELKDAKQELKDAKQELKDTKQEIKDARADNNEFDIYIAERSVKHALIGVTIFLSGVERCEEATRVAQDRVNKLVDRADVHDFQGGSGGDQGKLL